jgi:hypothetical protein
MLDAHSGSSWPMVKDKQDGISMSEKNIQCHRGAIETQYALSFRELREVCVFSSGGGKRHRSPASHKSETVWRFTCRVETCPVIILRQG